MSDGGVVYGLHAVASLLASEPGVVDRLLVSAASDRRLARVIEQAQVAGVTVAQVSRRELDQMLPEFYRLRGWDENGVPTPEKLSSLGIQ